jgi:hypothetical protein
MTFRSLITLVTLLVAFAATTVAAAAPTAPLRELEDTDLELVDGNGKVRVALRGALIGSVAKGSVTITDLPGGVETEVLVQGEEASWELDPGVTRYAGDDLRFRVFRGRWRVEMQGSGIFTSIVGAGSIGFSGEGRYSLAGGPYHNWPSVWTTLKLGTF